MKNKKISDLFQRDSFISTLLEYAKKDKKILLITNDQGAIALDDYKKHLPNQFINAGISEQNIISVAAGLQKEGFNCFIYSISSFIIYRAIEQIKIDLCSMKLPVKIFGVGSGYSYAIDGPTHHSTEDIGLLNMMPYMKIYSPSDSLVVKEIVKSSLNSSEPIYVRLDREYLAPLSLKKYNLDQGYRVIKKGQKTCIITHGYMLTKAYKIAKDIKHKNIGIIDVFKIKPLNKKVVKDLSKYKNIICLEEHNESGGLGNQISNLYFKNKKNINLVKIGLKEKTIMGYGSRDHLNSLNNLDEKSVTKLLMSLK